MTCLGRAAVATGCDALFMEIRLNPITPRPRLSPLKSPGADSLSVSAVLCRPLLQNRCPADQG